MATLSLQSESRATILRAQLSQAILLTRSDYVARGEADSYYNINNGVCDEFAYSVLEQLAPADEFLVCGGEEFMTGVDGDLSENDVWDWELLANTWGIKPPSGLSVIDMGKIRFGAHVWITDGTLHFDAECPEGVPSFFDLPLYRRGIICYLRKNGMPADDVVTDDVVQAPRCPVPNPTPI